MTVPVGIRARKTLDAGAPPTSLIPVALVGPTGIRKDAAESSLRIAIPKVVTIGVTGFLCPAVVVATEIVPNFVAKAIKSGGTEPGGHAEHEIVTRALDQRVQNVRVVQRLNKKMKIKLTM